MVWKHTEGYGKAEEKGNGTVITAKARMSMDDDVSHRCLQQ
jgi:hypothetical protein